MKTLSMLSQNSEYVTKLFHNMGILKLKILKIITKLEYQICKIVLITFF